MVPPCTTINLGHSISWGNHEAEDNSIFLKKHDHATLMIYISHKTMIEIQECLFSDQKCSSSIDITFTWCINHFLFLNNFFFFSYQSSNTFHFVSKFLAIFCLFY